MKLSEEARAARNAYKRAWNKKNREKAREYNMRYWERKAEKLREQRAEGVSGKETAEK